MQNRKKELLISLLAILSIFLITVGISFSFFNYARKGTEENSIKVGNVTFKYTENKDLGNGIVLTDALPIADSQGKIQTGEGKVFEFQVEANLSRSDIEYEVVVETVNDTNMPLDVIKFYLTDVTNGIEKEVETSINDDRSVKTLSEYNDTLIKNVTGKTIYKETIIKNTKGYQKRFKARMWVKEGIDWMNENYKNTQASIRINVYANSNKSIASTETTTSPDTSILRITANNKKYSFTKVNGEEYQYTLTVPNEVDTIDIDVVPNNTSATVELLEGNNNLQTGENFFKYKVMSSDQTKSSDYILRVVRQKNNVATLKKLEVAGYALQPDFDSEINEYNLTTEASSIEIIAESTSDVAIVTGTGTTNLIWGENTININVTAEDGSINTYIITITNTQPVAPVITGGSSSWSTTSKTISVKTAGTAVSGVSHYEYYKSTSSATPTDATEATGTTLGNLTVSDQGTTYIWYRTVSNNNLKSSWSSYQVVKIDCEKPSTPTITASDSVSSGSVHNSSFNLIFNISEIPISGITYYYGTSTSNMNNTGTSISVSNNSEATYYVKACNGAGICGDIASYVVVFDGAPIISFQFKGNQMAVTLSDGKALTGYAYNQTGTTPTKYTSISGTTKTFNIYLWKDTTYYVWVKDSAGNVTMDTFEVNENVVWNDVIFFNHVTQIRCTTCSGNASVDDYAWSIRTDNSLYALYTDTAGQFKDSFRFTIPDKGSSYYYLYFDYSNNSESVCAYFGNDDDGYDICGGDEDYGWFSYDSPGTYTLDASYTGKIDDYGDIIINNFKLYYLTVSY